MILDIILSHQWDYLHTGSHYLPTPSIPSSQYAHYHLNYNYLSISLSFCLSVGVSKLQVAILARSHMLGLHSNMSSNASSISDSFSTTLQPKASNTLASLYFHHFINFLPIYFMCFDFFVACISAACTLCCEVTASAGIEPCSLRFP